MAWEGKYKSDQYAQFYAGKHDATPLRRISNRFEIAMVRRSLHRVQRRVAFKTVLDCPSGTGRFLPTLAGFDVSVVAMDTSGSMLEQGRRHHPLFRIAPEMSVGSVLEIPLRDQCVDLVLCARLLHHFPNSDARVRVLTEFARVAKVGVVVTFFDASSYRGWRRMRKKRHSEKKHGRYAMTRAQCAREGAAAGLHLLGMNALLRFHTEITAAAFLTDATAKPAAPKKTQP